MAAVSLTSFLKTIIFFMDIVIGAGVTGLAYANFTSNPYLVIEADDHTGGLCNTIIQDGFVWDYSGHFFHFQNQEVVDFISQRIDRSGLITVKKHTQIKYTDLLIDFPFQKNIHQLPKDEFIDCLYDLFNTKETSQDTFKKMLYAKFGKSIAEKFLIPYNSKLYAVDLDRLDADAMGRFFPYADREEIIRNFRNTNASSYNGSFLYHKGGAIQYVNALQRDLAPDAISLNEKVLSINPEKHQLTTNSRTLTYDNLISTLPFVSLLGLCGYDYDRQALTWNKVLVFNLGFDGEGTDRLNHWIYFPEDKYIFYRVGFYNNIVGTDRMSLYVEIGLKPDVTVDVNDMLSQVLDGLRLADILHDELLISWHHVIMNPAYIHVNRQGIDYVARMKDTLSRHNIYSIGRYGSWNYSSIEDNMLEALTLAKQL